MPVFSHLHVHTQYSLLDGAASIKSLVKKAKADGMPALAITDHGNMYGAFEFYQAVTKEGMIPVIGCEFYMVEDRFKKAFTGGQKDKRYHQLILARNQEGYTNLAKLCSLGFLDGFYGKYPRIDKALLKQYSSGLIATSCCIGAEIPQAILFKSEETAEELLKEYLDIFGENYYIELQRHGLKNIDGTGMSQEDVNQTLIRLARKHNIPIIATNDSHYTDKKDANAHDILLCINTGEFQSTPRATNEESGKGFRFGFPNDEFFFKTQEEMNQLFSDIPEALDNTGLLISSIDPPKLSRDIVLPSYALPPGFEDEKAYLRHLAVEGCRKRYGGVIPADVNERLEFELATILDSGFTGYFLIVQDFTTAARDMGVWVGPGRGSAAGSLVAYCLGITNVDPVKYNLLFERFLNPERVSMPDVDIDFDDQGRDRVIDYVAKKYGERRIAQIVTYGTMAAKSAIRDVGRVLQYPLAQTDRLAKLVPGNMDLQEMLHADVDELGKDDSRNLKPEELDNLRELQKVYNNVNDEASQVLRDAEKLEGSVRGTGVHACGIIIAPRDIDEVVPVALSKDSKWMQVQYDVNQIEKAGLLKMDFLGLSTLTILKDALQIIKETTGDEIDLETLPLDDAKTYELFQRGETNGIFQFESAGMQKYMRELKPTQFADLIAMNALYRPGPIKYIPDYIDRRHGRKPVVFDLPEMEPYLRETYGITVYQEQVMLLSQKLAGFSKGKADELRKAMGKKNKAIIDQLKTVFMEGALANGHPADKLEKIYSDWEEFAQYAFNKSHSTCYAVLAYQTAYLKANYPAAFMAAVLKSNMGDIKKITFYMEECRRSGIKVLGPDLNESRSAFTVTPRGEIRFGMGALKGVGEGAVEEILKDRDENGPFASIFDLTARVNLRAVNKKNLEGMARAGVFDFDTRYHRAQYIKPDEEGKTGIELAIRYGQQVQADKISGQGSLFGGAADSTMPAEPRLPAADKMELLEELKVEEEVVGVFLSKHPLDNFRFEYEMITTQELKDLTELQNATTNTSFIVMGIVTSVRETISQKGEPFGKFVLMDYSGQFEFAMFGKDYLQWKSMLTRDYILIIKGAMEYSERSARTYCRFREVLLGSDLEKSQLVKSIQLDFTLADVKEGRYEIVKTVMEENPGNCGVWVNITDMDEKISVKMVSSRGIDFGEDVRLTLDEMAIPFTPRLDDRWVLN
ncbi:MAG: DNA polymerase III subunit alpha [Bacteroidetes bacterium]|nr:DNA polymerase III subunit alpha [Bacteroidota bacterium]